MIQHEIDVPLCVLTTMIGKRDAARVWQRSAQAVERLIELVNDLSISCSLERKRTLFLAGDQYGVRSLKKEVRARHKANIGAELLTSQTLLKRHGISRTAAIESAISASANPAQMTSGLLRHAARMGAEIVSGVEVKDVRSICDSVVVSTDAGAMISARHAIFCTGYEFLESLANKNHRVISTWALASRPRLPRPDWLDDYLVWEGSDPYLYFRATPDGRVIVGGEDESDEQAYKSEAKIVAKTKTLIEKVADIIGIEIGKPDFRWAAPFGTTPDGLPMIGSVPGMPGVFVTMGFGGNGITFSQIAAELVSSEIFDHRDPDWDLFPLH